MVQTSSAHPKRRWFLALWSVVLLTHLSLSRHIHHRPRALCAVVDCYRQRYLHRERLVLGKRVELATPEPPIIGHDSQPSDQAPCVLRSPLEVGSFNPRALLVVVVAAITPTTYQVHEVRWTSRTDLGHASYFGSHPGHCASLVQCLCTARRKHPPCQLVASVAPSSLVAPSNRTCLAWRCSVTVFAPQSHFDP